MALGANTLTVTIDGNAKVLRRINQDNFATRYYLHEGTHSYTANVRHKNETRGGLKYDTHSLELVQEVFPTLTTPGFTRTSWSSMRNLASDDQTVMGKFAKGQGDLFVASGNIADLLGWVG